MILVTGAAGFIGSQVATLLLEQGHEVVGVDNLDVTYDVRLKEWRLARLREQPGFTFQRVDITERGAVDALFEQGAPEGLVNLAAHAGVQASIDDPWAYYATNLTGTLNLLEACRAHGVGKFVLSSTSSAYGARGGAFREDDHTDRPLSPYAASKKAAETLCYTYHHLHGLDVSVLRYFTVYGPAGRPDMSIFRFIRQIAEGETLRVTGDGTQSRDFTFVEDVARGTVASLRPLGYEVINLGCDQPESINGVIATLEGLLEKPAQVTYVPSRPADVPTTSADITKARRLLEWEPRTRLAQGLARAVEWYRVNRDWLVEAPLP
ncbi:MAG: SDR family NAD(P)-dependent oxidoreductase [Chloroflexota bacterium]